MTECVCPFACTKSRRYMAIDSKFPLFCICVCPSFARMWNLILILFDSLVLILVHLSFPCDPKAKRIRLYAFVEPHFWENPFRSFYYEKKMSQKALKLKRLTKSKRTILISIWIRSHRNKEKRPPLPRSKSINWPSVFTQHFISFSRVNSWDFYWDWDHNSSFQKTNSPKSEINQWHVRVCELRVWLCPNKSQQFFIVLLEWTSESMRKQLCSCSCSLSLGWCGKCTTNVRAVHMHGIELCVHIAHRSHIMNDDKLLRSTHVPSKRQEFTKMCILVFPILLCSGSCGASICFSNLKLIKTSFIALARANSQNSTHLGEPKKSLFVYECAMCAWIKKLVLEDQTKWESRYNAHMCIEHTTRKKRGKRGDDETNKMK